MPCKPLIDKSGKACGFVCSRGHTKRDTKTCYICGEPATKLCDYRDSFTTCDRPMCDVHAHHIGRDTDYCDEHNNEFSRKRTDTENNRLGFDKETTP